MKCSWTHEWLDSPRQHASAVRGKPLSSRTDSSIASASFYTIGLPLTARLTTADPKDSRSLKDRAAAEHKLEKEEDEAAKHKPRPTEIAESHGNKPSKGAIMDENIQLEEEAELRKKGKI